MFTALSLLENAGIVASILLGTGTAACGAVLVVKTALSLTSASALASTPTRIRSATPKKKKKRASSGDVYRAIYCAALEAPAAATATAADATMIDDALPTFAKPAKVLHIEANAA